MSFTWNNALPTKELRSFVETGCRPGNFYFLIRSPFQRILAMPLKNSGHFHLGTGCGGNTLGISTSKFKQSSRESWLHLLKYL